MNIVLVDDDPDDVYLFTTACEHVLPKPELVILQDGEQLLEYVESHANATEYVYLVDLNMPKMGGLEAMSQLKAKGLCDKICLIGYTTSNHPGDIEQAFLNGAKSYITKPNRVSDLIDLLEVLLKYWFSYNHFIKENS